MEDLLRNDLTAHYDLPVCRETNLVIHTNEPYFEIEDTDVKEIVLHTNVGQGIARFHNPKIFEVAIANYEKFIDSLPTSFKDGKSRCDLVLSCDSYIVLGELKDRNISSDSKLIKVGDKAKNQLLQSLEILLAVPQIAVFASNKTN